MAGISDLAVLFLLNSLSETLWENSGERDWKVLSLGVKVVEVSVVSKYISQMLRCRCASGEYHYGRNLRCISIQWIVLRLTS